MSEETSSDSTVAVPRGHDLIKSILVIDRPEVTSVLKRLLNSCGWDAIEATNAGQARGLVARYKPDFILSETVLPGENGFEYCAFQKKLNCRIPFVFLTNVRLTAARNLAIWAGADAYLSKPIGGKDLYKSILTIANRVSFRIAKAEKNMAGSIRFKCSCGRRLEMGMQNAGRASICPSCRSMVRCPESAVNYGLLFEELRKEDRQNSISAAGVVCRSCRRTVSPDKCRVRDSYECTECGTALPITAEAAERWELFFRDSENEPEISEFNPLDFVYVRCEQCSTFHKYFTHHETPSACPGCGHAQSLPSVTGAPLSRAALNSTGRLFETIVNGRRKTIFLAPLHTRITAGSDSRCTVRISEPDIQNLHCILYTTAEGPVVRPKTPECTLRVRKRQIEGTHRVNPGDVIWLSKSACIRLCGNKAGSDRELISDIQRTFKDNDELAGSLEFSQPGADVIQLYWEQQREQWKARQRKLPPFVIEVEGTEVDFPANQTLLIGRGIECQVRLFSDPNVERHHCAIRHNGSSVAIRDNNTQSGTWLGRERITECEMEVNENAQFQIGDTRFRIKRPAGSALAKPR